MPIIKRLSLDEDRERKLELTKIRKLRRIDPDEADRRMRNYRKTYFLLPPGPKKKSKV